MNFCIWSKKLKRAVTRQHTSRPMYHDMTTYSKQETDCVTTVQWFIDFVMFIGVVTKESRYLVTTSLSKKAKLKHVDLSEVKMDCRCRKLSPFLCQFLSAVGKSEKDCRHIFEQCRLSPKPLGRPLKRRIFFKLQV